MLQEQCVCMALLSCCVSCYCFCLHQLHGSGVGSLVGLVNVTWLSLVTPLHITAQCTFMAKRQWMCTSFLLNFRQSQLIHCSLHILLFYNNTWHDTIIIKYSIQNNNEKNLTFTLGGRSTTKRIIGKSCIGLKGSPHLIAIDKLLPNIWHDLYLFIW